MYDPAWYPEKAISAIAEAVALLGAAVLVLAPRRNTLARKAPQSS
ncbi:MAG TPA: hypothetical protein VHU61_15215 [Solirubrobacteraceae bacterium]|jgi:hypothetical protein|nr:hypothetical protein [Solirubrobacteraceae bacterium]